MTQFLPKRPGRVERHTEAQQRMYMEMIAARYGLEIKQTRLIRLEAHGQ